MEASPANKEKYTEMRKSTCIINMELNNCQWLPKIYSHQILKYIQRAMIHMIKYLRTKWIRYQQWSRLSLGAFRLHKKIVKYI